MRQSTNRSGNKAEIFAIGGARPALAHRWCPYNRRLVGRQLLGWLEQRAHNRQVSHGLLRPLSVLVFVFV
jgi:hypothetical protein